MKTGLLIECDNGHVYTLKKNKDSQYPFDVIDEFGEVVTLTLGYVIDECIRLGERLCVGVDYRDNLKYTKIVRYRLPGEKWCVIEHEDVQ